MIIDFVPDALHFFVILFLHKFIPQVSSRPRLNWKRAKLTLV